MENPRPEKVAVVDEVRARLSGADAAVLTEYRGLNVQAMSELRRALRAAGGEYKIYKNTLLRFAARDLGLEIDALLTGPTAIAFVDGDAAAVAKALRDYARTHPNLVVKGGLLGTQVIDAASVTALADLPSREQLLSQIAGLFAAPMQQFAALLDAVPRSFAYALQALIDKTPADLEAPVAESEAAPEETEAAPEETEAAPEPEAAADAAPEADAQPDVAAEATATTEDTNEAPAAEADAPAEET
jgi:large subunit ribosomal protein L10